jgi:NAD(P)H-flavin reductase
MVRENKNESLGKVAVANPMTSQLYLIERVTRETRDTFTLKLVSKERNMGHSFAPGQFNMVYVYGTGEVPISISGDPGKRDFLTHTIRAVGTVTRAMGKLKTGDSLGIRGPYGIGWPVEEAVGYDVVLVAGGIGLAPLRPVLYYLLTHREKFGKIVLLYGTRTPDDILYRNELKKWQSRFDLEIHVTVDQAVGAWQGNVGVVTALISRVLFNPFHAIAMVCGPEIMMRFTALELQKRGVAGDKIYVSMERNMKCGIGLCGHCQMGSEFICKNGPVYNYDYVRDFFKKRET